MTALTDLITQLEVAVRDGDHAQAHELARRIRQRIVLEGLELDAIERRVNALLATLDAAPVQAPLTVPAPAAPAVDFPASPAPVKLKNVLGTVRTTATGKAAKGTVYPVWFGTNRRPDGLGGFGTTRHPTTTRGRVEVFVPEGHRFGEIGTPFWKKMLRFDLRDDTLRLQRVQTQTQDTWYDDIRKAMQAAQDAGEAPHALVFLHGFNVTFEEAAIRAAQISADLLVPGATAFFSWPSRGSVRAYTVDEASIEASEQAITDFLVDFAARCGAQKLHVIAHSMGNRGLLRALQRIAANAETRGKVRFDQIFLAAPDVDRDLFLDLARLYRDHGQRTTLYASDGDLPVHVSSKIHDAPRAGYFEPYTVTADVDTIAVPDFDLDMLGHSYFAQAESLLNHMRDLMLNGKATVSGNRLAPAEADGMRFWRLKR